MQAYVAHPLAALARVSAPVKPYLSRMNRIAVF
jgi:hypothetical protein